MKFPTTRSQFSEVSTADGGNRKQRMRLTVLAVCASLVALAGCSAPQPVTAPPSALLLVSLDDGSIIAQDIAADADVCMKTANDSATVCFQRNRPLVQGNVVVGYHMTRTEIQLVAE